MSEFGKYGVGGSVPGKPLKAPDEEVVGEEVKTGTETGVPDKK